MLIDTHDTIAKDLPYWQKKAAIEEES